MLQKLPIGMFFSEFGEKNMPTKLLPYSESEVGRVGNFISPDDDCCTTLLVRANWSDERNIPRHTYQFRQACIASRSPISFIGHFFAVCSIHSCTCPYSDHASDRRR